MKKINSVLSLLLFITSSVCAFDWPQEKIIESDEFYSYFGQLRGGTISNSLIFTDTSTVKACDDGYLTLLIEDYDDISNYFPSTLGNAALISHSDNLMTIYGNLDSEGLAEDIFETTEIKQGTKLGESGNSAWQQGRSSLEFQVVDTSQNIAINPRHLMPRVGKELPLSLLEVKIQNTKTGRFYSLPENNQIPSGTYKVYKKRQNIATPYKTRVALNGTTADLISYEELRQTEGTLSVKGKKNYIKSQIYPNNEQILMGEVSITTGKNTLTLTAIDMLGKEYIGNYIITVW